MTGELHSSTHPPTPPTTEEERHSWLRLLRSRRVGITTFYRLLAEHGSAQNALAALPEVARQAGIEGYEICPAGVVDAELKAARAAEARLLCLGEIHYPAQLSDIPDPPPMIWAAGNLDLLQRPKISMVGARNASSLGLRVARSLAKDLGKAGFTVVSGLARGIDTAAHEGSLPSGTIAVFAGGVDVVYPEENARLAQNIRESGVVVSDQPMGQRPMARHFPKRNRIIAGLGLAVVVVEAATKSGSLITAQDALDIGRDVLAVPGHPIDPRSGGCNMLIRDGATLIRNADDVAEAIGHIECPPAPVPNKQKTEEASPPSVPTSQPSTREIHQEILNRLGPTPVAEDQVLRDLPHSVADLGAALTELELDGRVLRDRGGLLRSQP